MINYWYPCMDVDYEEYGSWFGLAATAERLRRTQLGHARVRRNVLKVDFIRADTFVPRRWHSSSTGM